jgi:hypothetical protein
MILNYGRGKSLSLQFISAAEQVTGHIVGNDKHFQHLGVEDFQDVVYGLIWSIVGR